MKNVQILTANPRKGGGSDLLCDQFLLVHSGRFSISNHGWDAPYKRFAAWWRAEAPAADNTPIRPSRGDE